MFSLSNITFQWPAILRRFFSIVKTKNVVIICRQEIEAQAPKISKWQDEVKFYKLEYKMTNFGIEFFFIILMMVCVERHFEPSGVFLRAE